MADIIKIWKTCQLHRDWSFLCTRFSCCWPEFSYVIKTELKALTKESSLYGISASIFLKLLLVGLDTMCYSLLQIRRTNWCNIKICYPKETWMWIFWLFNLLFSIVNFPISTLPHLNNKLRTLPMGNHLSQFACKREHG